MRAAGSLFVLCVLLAAASPVRSGDKVLAARTRYDLNAAEALLRRRLAALPPGNAVGLLRDSDRVTLRIPAAVLFPADSSELLPDPLQQPVLKAAIEVLRRRHRLVGQVNVYSDAIGGQIANHAFTEMRSLALLTALRASRIRPTRLTGAGLGAADEIGSDATPEGREKNRRIEVVFSEGDPARTG